MFNWFKTNKSQNKVVEVDDRSCYKIAKETSDEFEKTCDYTKYETEAIKTIERRILKYSKEGVREVSYDCHDSFPYHANMWKVIEYFEKQGFKVRVQHVYKSDVRDNHSVFVGKIYW